MSIQQSEACETCRLEVPGEKYPTVYMTTDAGDEVNYIFSKLAGNTDVPEPVASLKAGSVTASKYFSDLVDATCRSGSMGAQRAYNTNTDVLIDDGTRSEMAERASNCARRILANECGVYIMAERLEDHMKLVITRKRFNNFPENYTQIGTLDT